jgi:hypothetical protein
MSYRNCAGVRRRSFLQLGLGSLLGGTVYQSLSRVAQAAPAEEAVSPVAKSCILIWLDGGPTHYETFDPKPLAPAEIRGQFEPIPTQTPGVFFSEHLQQLAVRSNKFAVIRSICHEQGNHGAGNHYMMTGAPPRIPVGCGAFVSYHPSLGSATAHNRGHLNGLPAYMSLPSMTRSGGPNFLGAEYAPFVVPDDPNSSGFRVRDVALPKSVDTPRFDRRQELRRRVDRLVRVTDAAAADPTRALDQYYQQGQELMLSAQAQAAFDIQKETDDVRQTYGRNSFGQRALLARRLVEAGVPFVVLNEGGWDHHTDLFNSFKKRMPAVDGTLSALIDDLDQRGLLASTLVVMLGEFGRTPKINKDSGRDHWSNAMSVFMAGAGIPGGLCLGATDRQGYSAVERVLSPENFASSIYKKLGIDPDQVLYTPQGRPSHLVSDPTPIAELFA